MTNRAFRAAMRHNAKVALAAAKALSHGCALTPAYTNIISAIKHLEMAKSLLSVERWKR